VWLFYPLRISCSLGYLDLVKLLLDDKPNPLPFRSLWLACEKGRTEVVEFLLSWPPKLVPPSQYGELLGLACSKGHLEIARLLLKEEETDPMTNGGYPFRSACEWGREDIVSMLLEESRVDPTAGENYGLLKALQYCHPSVVKLLLMDSRVNPYLTQILLFLMARRWSTDSEDEEESGFSALPLELSTFIARLMLLVHIQQLYDATYDTKSEEEQ
jgi:ankyrin repeat protein